jgi:hypothetical protein
MTQNNLAVACKGNTSVVKKGCPTKSMFDLLKAKVARKLPAQGCTSSTVLGGGMCFSSSYPASASTVV